MSHFHAIVWIDHREARVFHFNQMDVDTLVLHSSEPTRHLHHKANTIGSGNVAENHEFFEDVTQAVADAGQILIMGPANAKTELMKHIQRDHPELIKLVAGVETADHPTDGELVAHARKYFKSTDRMTSQ